MTLSQTSTIYINPSRGEVEKDEDDQEDQRGGLQPPRLLCLPHPGFVNPAKEPGAPLPTVASGFLEGIVGNLLGRQRDRRSPHEDSIGIDGPRSANGTGRRIREKEMPAQKRKERPGRKE